MNIGLTIPHRFYRAFNELREIADKMKQLKPGRVLFTELKGKMCIIGREYIYERFNQIHDFLGPWLLAHVGDGSYNVLSCDDRTFILGRSDNPFGCYWTMEVQQRLSEQYRFGGLWERAINDP